MKRDLFTPEHEMLRKTIRAFVEKEVAPHARARGDTTAYLRERQAKLLATEVANRVACQAVQLHGGDGSMREFAVEGFFRDVRLWTIASGTSEVLREIIARRLLP